MKSKIKDENVIHDIYKNFINIKDEYKPVNFWGWNDLIKEEGVRTQVEFFKRAGAGGFFIHARSGLKTTYLSDEWMRNVKIAIEEAKRLGIKCWLYDEENFPSGYAGGKVPALGEKYWQRALIFSISRGKKEFADLISIYSMKKEKKALTNMIVNPIFADKNNYVFKKISDADIEQEINNDSDIIYLFVEKAKTGSKHFNGYCYVDILSKRVADSFLQCTHEKYYNEFKNEFGKTIPGIFTDEPSILYYPDFAENSLPWTDDLLDVFVKRNGYKLEENLIYLFFNIEGYEKIRFDYWKLISDMFLNNYTKNIYNWCKNHNLLFTGHFMYEEDLVDQVKWSGSVMPHYEYMDIPAIDKLFRTIEHPMTIKQVSSVANQLGKDRVGSEVFGASGQSLSFEDMKWVADWQAALGINMLIPHISLYSLYGSRKRDYPPNIFFQQPWWEYAEYIFNYFSRLSYILSIGKYDAKVLVINPITSIWTSYSPIEQTFSKEINDYFELLIRELLENQICFDLGDEEILLKHSEIKKGKLIIGKSEYDIVIVPPSINIYENTLGIFSEFLENGGKLISIKPLPYMINGVVDKRVENVLINGIVLDLFGKIKGNYHKKFDNSLIDFLKANLGDYINFTDQSGNPVKDIYLHQRSGKDFKIFFLINISRNKRYKVNINMPGDGDVEIWDLFNGERARLKDCNAGGSKQFFRIFNPVSSCLLVQHESKFIDKEIKIESNQLIFSDQAIKEEICLGGEWLFKKSDSNILLLDYCDLRIGGKTILNNTQICQVEKEIRNNRSEDINLIFKFNIKSARVLKNDIYLAIEEMKGETIKINGENLQLLRTTAYFLDQKIKKYEISKHLKIGINKIEISGFRYPGLELDCCYLLGDFLVFLNKNYNCFELEEIKPAIEKGSLVNAGFPFYCGRFSFIKNFKIALTDREKVYISCKNIISSISSLYLNGKLVDRIYNKNYEQDISNFVTNGQNKLEIEICTSLFNIFGPLHHKGGELYEVNPESFCTQDSQTGIYNFKNYGLIGDVKLLISYDR